MDEIETAISLRLLGQPDPGLRHVDQDSFRAGFIRIVGQPQAFQRVLAIVIRSIHGVASAASTQLEPRTLIRAIRSRAVRTIARSENPRAPREGHGSARAACPQQRQSFAPLPVLPRDGRRRLSRPGFGALASARGSSPETDCLWTRFQLGNS